MNQHAEFARVRRDGQSSAGRYLVLATLADPALPRPKFAFVTSRKTGRAVTRNLLRRRLRRILSLHGEKISWPRYLVTIARWNAARATPAQLEKDWLRQAGKLKILTAPCQGKPSLPISKLK